MSLKQRVKTKILKTYKEE